ncbi:TadE/TadG family type IV pilus assembly protein [Aurantiacibacter spongiae]|uniref:Pilus assembly protein n=1 Tax=Aurantiacibacter spongiae TaxID=2488860 RepID=A0A3N5CUD3_9SPHN|nr:TadE/TadG family type IV pilus assembly protein [Aurantiacibacter spongiae]RPF71936.1 pilus assembly protein [Aurantiacibacter spongiae]
MIARRVIGDERGVTIVEFAIVAPILLLILIAGFDLGHRSYVGAVLQGAVTDAARRASVEAPALRGTGALEDRVETMIWAQIRPVAANAELTVTQSNFYDFSGIGNPEKITVDRNDNGVYDEEEGDCFSDLNENGEFDLDTGRDGRGGANDVVFYQARLEMESLLPIASFLGGSNRYAIVAETAIRNQPWETQRTPPVVCGVPA